MPTSVADYVIDQSGIDWPTVLPSWSWLLPPKFTVWLVNRFADLFLILPDGTVHMWDVGVGSLSKLTSSRDEFLVTIDEEDNANQWFMIPLVDELVAAGVIAQSGQCYGFTTPPVLGGDYTAENVGPLSLCEYLSSYGSIHGRLQDVPDGSQVVLKVVGKPA